MSHKKPSILFITTSNLITNPRLRKEIELLLPQYNCSLLCFNLNNWSEPHELQLRARLSDLSVRACESSRSPFFSWVLASFVQFIALKFSRFFGNSIWIHAMASNKRSWLLSRELKIRHSEYDLIIAHNLGALYPAYKYSKRKSIPFGFDVEDYHPGEHIAVDELNEKKRREILFQKLLTHASYISYASPLIANRVEELLHGKHELAVTINNSFHKAEFSVPPTVSGKMRFVWFSQNINFGRGLEKVIPLLKKHSEHIELHLIGHLNPRFFTEVLADHHFITTHLPMEQQKLHEQMGAYDIGLALESIEQDENRDICLTNKIFTYAQSGLYILATPTSAQIEFIKQHPWVGEIINNDDHEKLAAFERVLYNVEQIRGSKTDRYKKAAVFDYLLDFTRLEAVLQQVLEQQ